MISKEETPSLAEVHFSMVPRVVHIANNPAPYRIPIFNELVKDRNFSFQVIFSSEREPSRDWNLPEINFTHYFLKTFFISKSGNFIHANFDVINRLSEISPNMILLGGFNPTNFLAFLYAIARGCKIGLLIDGTDLTEAKLSMFHKIIRRIIYPKIDVAIGPGVGTFRLFTKYGLPKNKIYKSHLCVNNSVFVGDSFLAVKDYDFIYCGRFAPEKNLSFVLDVAAAVANVLARTVTVLMVGSGPDDFSIKEYAKNLKGVEVVFPGFSSQEDLPKYYRTAKICLFPSLGDAWGVMANEACASGVPVVVSPFAGVVDDLIIDGVTGFVRVLDVEVWCKICVQLLTQPDLYQAIAQRCRMHVEEYNFVAAANGLKDGIYHALNIYQ